MADELLCTLISASEKASKIARLCRENEDLFSLLIEEKGERNNELDFKTFADVFIQQVIVKEVSSKFGDLGDRVKGEENNLFTNTLGESVAVEIMSDADATADVIAKVLGEHKNAASLLANAAHEPTSFDMEAVVPSETLALIGQSGLDLNNLGIWVDPIDCTSQYVKGIENSVPLPSGVYETGLQCVLVLIGVHCLDTGFPVAGVINQPFSKRVGSDCEKKWSGRCTWGFSYHGVKKNNVSQTANGNIKPLVMLSMHDPAAKATVDNLSGEMDKCLSRGAGYKCITVADRSSDAFLYTNNGSYKWDTCAPHAILLSCGGGIAVLKDAVRSYDAASKAGADIGSVFESCQVLYCQHGLGSSANWKANTGGIIAYNSSSASARAVNQIMRALDAAVL